MIGCDEVKAEITCLDKKRPYTNFIEKETTVKQVAEVFFWLHEFISSKTHFEMCTEKEFQKYQKTVK